jgi:peptide-methionine (S)-S-oxide reductase
MKKILSISGLSAILLVMFAFGGSLACNFGSSAAPMNSAAAAPTPKPVISAPASTATNTGANAAPAAKSEIQTAVFAGGCFWGIEAVFDHVKGVTEARSGYSGGTKKNPSYDQVSTGDTGHAESVQVMFDPAQVSYKQLLQIFFASHDPTELNFQGPDHGTQYRTNIFYANDEQKKEAEDYIAELNKTKTFSNPIVTLVTPLDKFYDAESYHQNYLKLHPDDPYIVYNDQPKVANLHKQFPDLYVEK